MRDYSDSVEWLLRSEEPSIRYLTMRDVLNKPEGDERLEMDRSEIPNGRKVRALLRGQKKDGGFSVHPYRKWIGSHWRLVSLVNLALPTANSGALRAAKLSMDWLHSAGIKRAFKPVNGRVRMHASVYGNAVLYWSYLGLAGEPRVKHIVRLILDAQWEDGGWNCDPNLEAKHSSFHETLATLNGLLEYHRKTGDKDVKRSIDAAAELFLSHRIFRSHRTGEIVKKEWLKLRYPVYWHYNFLESMRVLCLAGRGGDSRMKDGLDLLEQKCQRTGQWETEGRYWRPFPSKGGSRRMILGNEEVVDWGQSGPNEMITLNALRVLKAAGRL